ncbi:MAG: RNA polymerase sigma factor [Solirubrobacteraceae bacterium]
MRERSDQRRSKRAFEDLYDGVARRLLVYLVRRMQSPEAATELWCECWAQAFDGWHRCKAGSRNEAEAWIFGIARNQLKSYYRTGRIRRVAVDELKWTIPVVDSGEFDQLERAADLAALRELLGNALSDLPAMRREAVELRVLSGMAYRDVAARLGCSEQAARAHVSRGLRCLERILDQKQVKELQGAI